MTIFDPFLGSKNTVFLRFLKMRAFHINSSAILNILEKLFLCLADIRYKLFRARSKFKLLQCRLEKNFVLRHFNCGKFLFVACSRHPSSVTVWTEPLHHEHRYANRREILFPVALTSSVCRCQEKKFFSSQCPPALDLADLLRHFVYSRCNVVRIATTRDSPRETHWGLFGFIRRESSLTYNIRVLPKSEMRVNEVVSKIETHAVNPALVPCIRSETVKNNFVVLYREIYFFEHSVLNYLRSNSIAFLKFKTFLYSNPRRRFELHSL